MTKVFIPAGIKDKSIRDTFIAILRELNSSANKPTVSEQDPDSNTVGTPGQLIYSEASNSIWMFVQNNWSKILGSEGADGADGSNGSNGSTGSTGSTGDTLVTGKVYFGSLQPTAPSTPNATSYNFTTGTFIGLTDNWSQNQPHVSVTNTSLLEWSSFFTVTKNGANNAQTISFTSAEGAIQFTVNIESDNFDAGYSGWRIQRDTGNAEFGSASIRGTLTADQIGGGTINADKLSAASISALGLTIGTLSSAATGERTVISDTGVTVYDSSNVVRVKLGNLT
jgi:hypothetical protein